MKRWTATLCAGLLLQAGYVPAQPTPTDAEVLKGIEQVESGDYDLAIFTLDTACRRLDGDPSKSAELSQAYLYLGIAYFGKGHEAAAKAKFREAVLQFRDLSLSAEEYPPKIVDLFEAARQEANSAEPAPAAASTPTTPTPAAPPAAAASDEGGGGGSKMPLILLGVGGAAAAGIAVAAGGGGSDEPVAPERTTRTLSGTLAEPDDLCRGLELFVQANGTLEATVEWNNPEVLDVYLWMGEPWNSDAVRENRTSQTSARLEATVTQRSYLLDVCLGWSDCRQAWQDSGGTTHNCATEFNATISHP